MVDFVFFLSVFDMYLVGLISVYNYNVIFLWVCVGMMDVLMMLYMIVSRCL